VRSGVGLRTAALVGPGHRIPILYGRCLITPDITRAGMGGFYRGEFQVVISEGPIDAVESWLADADAFDFLTVTLGTMSTPGAGLQGTIGLAAAFIRTKPGRPYRPGLIARGRKPYDPRLGAWGAGFYPDPTKCAYSTNPALCMADLKSFPQYGTGWPTVTPARVNWQSVADAADWCDELISGAKRYELNLYVQLGKDAKLWEDSIGLHAGLRWREEGGLWHLDFSGPVTTVSDPITTDHLVEDSTPRLVSAGGAGLADRPNVFTAEWIDPLAGWITRTVTVRHPAVEAGLEAERPARVYQLHGFQTETMAHRALWRIAHEVWSEQTLEADLTSVRLDLVEGSRVPVILPSVGLAGAEYLVTKTTYDADIVRVTARRYDATTWGAPAGGENALPGEGFFDTPGDVTAAAVFTARTAVTSSTPTQKIEKEYYGLEWEPPSFSYIREIVVREWDTSGGSPSWDTAGYTEHVFPAAGDPTLSASPKARVSLEPLVRKTITTNYDALGHHISGSVSGNGRYFRLRVRSLAGAMSSGVLVSEGLSYLSTGSTNPRKAVERAAAESPAPADGEVAVWDATFGGVRFEAASGGGKVLRAQEFLSGSTNWTAPAGVTEVWVTGCGGGGGGGGTKTGGGGCGGGGGGGGQSVFRMRLSVTAGNTYSVSIGAAGAAGTDQSVNPTNGGTGGNTTFGGLLTLTGGSGGVRADGSVGAAGGAAGGSGATRGYTGETYIATYHTAARGGEGGLSFPGGYGSGGIGSGSAGGTAKAGSAGYLLVEWNE
jgi:hypothetical protein